MNSKYFKIAVSKLKHLKSRMMDEKASNQRVRVVVGADLRSA